MVARARLAQVGLGGVVGWAGCLGRADGLHQHACCQISQGFAKFCRILLDFDRFCQILPDFAGFVPDCGRFGRALALLGECIVHCRIV